MTVSPTLPRTEGVDESTIGLDTWTDDEILKALHAGQRRAIDAVEAAIPALSQAAELGAASLRGGGRLIYLGAGSPALMSLADALELPQTYGIPHDRIRLILADGASIATRLDGSREDSAEAAETDVRAQMVGPADCVIATSASGSTPYTVGGLAAAKAAGAATIAIAGNASAKLFAAADVAVLLDVGPEVIAGSTRMGAGTAQKAALNMLSTLIGVKLGHVHDGLMVNVLADNVKLRGRAQRIITHVTGASSDQAKDALQKTGGAVKEAILLAAGADSHTHAAELLATSRGKVRDALALLISAASGPRTGS